MAEQGNTRSLSSKLNLKMNWDGQLGPSVAKLGLNKNRDELGPAQPKLSVLYLVPVE